MNLEHIRKIIDEAGHIRVSATREEYETAEYLVRECEAMGIPARIEAFPVPVTEIHEAHLWADGTEIPCTGYELCGSGTVEAPLVYLPAVDAVGLTKVKDRIVLLDTRITTFDYQDMLDAGALGFITYDGDVKWPDRDIDLKELRSFTALGRTVLCVNVNAKDAVELVKALPVVKISIEQTESEGASHNVIAEIPGKTDEWIILSAHYDSRPTSPGVYDNLTGCIGILSILEELKKIAPNRYGIRACFVGSEERGLLGSKAYVRDHEQELAKAVLNINIDMIGAIMGRLVGACNCEQSAVELIRASALEQGVSIRVMQRTMSSDSSAFADKGVPAISFGKMAPHSQAVIHCRYDTKDVVSAKQIQEDAAFITGFASRLANAAVLPISRKIPDNIKKSLDEYFFRVRKSEQA